MKTESPPEKPEEEIPGKTESAAESPKDEASSAGPPLEPCTSRVFTPECGTRSKHPAMWYETFDTPEEEVPGKTDSAAESPKDEPAGPPLDPATSRVNRCLILSTVALCPDED